MRGAVVHAIRGPSWSRVRCPVEEALFVLPAEQRSPLLQGNNSFGAVSTHKIGKMKIN